MSRWENCSVPPATKEVAGPPSHGQVLLEQLVQRSFHCFPKPKGMKGKEEVYPPWVPSLFLLLEMLVSSTPILPL